MRNGKCWELELCYFRVEQDMPFHSVKKTCWLFVAEKTLESCVIGGVNLTAYEGNSVSFNLLNRFQTQLRNSQQQSATRSHGCFVFPLYLAFLSKHCLFLFFSNFRLLLCAGISPVAQLVKNLTAKAGDVGDLLRHRFDSWVGRFPGEGNNSILVFLPGKFHGQKSLADYGPWGHTCTPTADQQCCGGFRRTAKGLSLAWTCIHSPPNPSPIQADKSHWVEFQVLYNRSSLVIHLEYSSVYMTFPNSLQCFQNRVSVGFLHAFLFLSFFLSSFLHFFLS